VPRVALVMARPDAAGRELRLLAGIALLGASLVRAERLEGSTVLCPFRRATGLPCPACGVTRSWSAALRGRLGDSVSYHPLGLPALAAACCLAMGVEFDNEDLPAWTRSRALPAVLAATWLGVWVARLTIAGRRRNGARSA
jgi:hypothetical protein